MDKQNDAAAKKAADFISQSKKLIISAGAGMGVDSGLPDFRGNEGFWKAYPPYRKLGLSFIDAANPSHFRRDPAFGWGFYGHRLHLYRSTIPHEGFDLLRRWIDRFSFDTFVVTSNVDGQFQKAGFDSDKVLEVHGSIHHAQCLAPCGDTIWPNHETIDVDLEKMRATHIPLCPDCGGTARPNILMFGDSGWISHRTDEQWRHFDLFLQRNIQAPLTIIELGAGTGVPTIRHLDEQILQTRNCALIRINPRESFGPPSTVEISCPALQGLRQIDRRLNSVHNP